MQNSLPLAPPGIWVCNLSGEHYYNSHFMGDKTEAQKFANAICVALLARGRANTGLPGPRALVLNHRVNLCTLPSCGTLTSSVECWGTSFLTCRDNKTYLKQLWGSDDINTTISQEMVATLSKGLTLKIWRKEAHGELSYLNQWNQGKKLYSGKTSSFN